MSASTHELRLIFDATHITSFLKQELFCGTYESHPVNKLQNEN